MDDTLARLQAKRAALMADVARIDVLIAETKRLMDEIDDVVGELLGQMPEHADAAARHDDGTVTFFETKKRTRGPNGSPPDKIVEAAIQALRENDNPMTRYELVAAVEGAGLTIGGTDKPRNLGTILWRSGKFENAGDGYWPKLHE